MIKVIKTTKLARCPVCGGEVELRRNSGKRFQIKCTNPACYVRTAWNSKTDTLCNWSEITARLAYEDVSKKSVVEAAFGPELQSASSVYRDRVQKVVKE